jgi:hypothetical protein
MADQKNGDPSRDRQENNLFTRLERKPSEHLQNTPIQWHTKECPVRVGVGPDSRNNRTIPTANDTVDRQVEVLMVQEVKSGSAHREVETLGDIEVL